MLQPRMLSVYLNSRISGIPGYAHGPTDKFPDTRLRIRELTGKPEHTARACAMPDNRQPCEACAHCPAASEATRLPGHCANRWSGRWQGRGLSKGTEAPGGGYRDCWRVQRRGRSGGACHWRSWIRVSWAAQPPQRSWSACSQRLENCTTTSVSARWMSRWSSNGLPRSTAREVLEWHFRNALLSRPTTPPPT